MTITEEQLRELEEDLKSVLFRDALKHRCGISSGVLRELIRVYRASLEVQRLSAFNSAGQMKTALEVFDDIREAFQEKPCSEEMQSFVDLGPDDDEGERIANLGG